MTVVKEGSIWTDGKEVMFQVIQTAEAEGGTWVHYREYFKKYKHVSECKEFSCLLESFTFRFVPLVDQ